MTKKSTPKKIENNMKDKQHPAKVEDFINNTHQRIKNQQQNIYPKDIRVLFERLGI
jgi:hypothetical protein